MEISTDRLRGMVWGAFLGDAAALGTHWIYNLEDLREKYPEGIHGFEAPKAGHYHAGKEPGAFTHYGDAYLLLLESTAEHGGFDPLAFGQRFVERMGPGSYQGYVDSATRGTVENYRDWRERHPEETYNFQNGADDDQLATATSLPALVARYAGEADWLDRVATLTRVRQNNGRAIAYARTQADLLGELLQGTDLHSALHRVEERAGKDPDFGPELLRRFRDAFERKHLPMERATGELGQACPLISSFPASLHALLREPENFRACLTGILAAGGDNAGRASLAGGCLGAHLGEEALPADWKERVRAGDRIERALASILAARHH